jgi:F0F1-type ATP synthase membrane subunit b/b'
MLTIRQPVAVKLILTEQTKEDILNESRNQIERLTNELEQIEEQGKQALEQAMSQGGDVAQQLRQQIEQEQQNRLEQREELIQQIQQVQQLELGTEVQNMTVETTVDVKVGDDWGQVLQGAEIIVKDGLIHEIRRGGIVFPQ